MEIINNIRNDLLKRNEVICLVESEKNPSFDEMKKQVSEQVGKVGGSWVMNLLLSQPQPLPLYSYKEHTNSKLCKHAN